MNYEKIKQRAQSLISKYGQTHPTESRECAMCTLLQNLFFSLEAYESRVAPGNLALVVRLDDPAFEHWYAGHESTLDLNISNVYLLCHFYCLLYQQPLIPREYRKVSTGDFYHDLLRLNWYIISADRSESPGLDWGYVVAALEAFAAWYQIDLEPGVNIMLRELERAIK